ncbi:MAG: hypothetical protein FJ012_09300 [Chloroflexi bacterium]|nr:hypothetical protein [Chloroflexota bacterium]
MAPISPERFTEQAQDVLAASQELVRYFKHDQWDVEHVLLALLWQEDSLAAKLLKRLGVDDRAIRQQVETALDKTPTVTYEGAQIFATHRTPRLLEAASAEAERIKDEFIGAEHLLIGTVAEEEGEAARIFRSSGVDQESIYRTLHDNRGARRVTDRRAESKYRSLEKYGRDLTELARLDKIDPVIGREEEIRRVIQILSRRTRNNPIIIGEAGVGKTAIAEGPAQKSVAGDVPDSLTGWSLPGNIR